MKKRLFALFLAAVLLLGSVAFAQEEAADTRVFDYAGFFSAKDVETLRAAIIDFQENTGYDFAILTTNEDLGEVDYQQLCDNFYVDKTLGLGMNHTALLCYLDLFGDYFYISVYGDLKYMMVEEDILYLADNALEYFKDGSFVDGFMWTMYILTDALANIGTLDQNTRVFDYAQILSDEEQAALESAITAFRALSGRDFLFLSTYEELEGNAEGVYMVEFYNRHGFGAGDNRSGAMIYLDLFYGNFKIKNFGDMDTFVSQESLDTLVEQINPLMGENKILEAVLQVLQAYSKYFE